MELAVSIVMLLILLTLIVLTIAGFWMVFVKAGEKGWKALIPFYNLYILFKISGLSGWWFGVLFIPLSVVILGAWVVEIPTNVLVNQEALPFRITLLFNLFFASLQVIFIVFSVMTYRVAQSFQKGLPFTLGLSLLGFIFWPVLGFGDAQYVEPSNTDCSCGNKHKSVDTNTSIDSDKEEEVHKDNDHNNESNKEKETEYTDNDSLKDSSKS